MTDSINVIEWEPNILLMNNHLKKVMVDITTNSIAELTAWFRHFLKMFEPLSRISRKIPSPILGAMVCEKLHARLQASSLKLLFFLMSLYLDAYLWMGLASNGPIAKFHMTNVHTIDEMRLIGNCVKCICPVLKFWVFRQTDIFTC